MKVKFNRTEVQKIASLGDVSLYISGKMNGAAFIGNFTIRVIEITRNNYYINNGENSLNQ